MADGSMGNTDEYTYSVNLHARAHARSNGLSCIYLYLREN